MSFYRTYRPQIIDEIDNLAVREALLQLLSKPKKDLPHAFIFSGPRGAGKTTAARVVAKIFNCEKKQKTGPCGTCEQCISIATGTNIDVLELDAASNRGIDEIRQLRDGIALAPAMATHKVYIIDEVHMLTTEAFNALLKTLEEPPGHAVFVLATTDLHKVPVTIISRCMSFVFSKAKIEELEHALTRIVKKEKIPIDDEAITRIGISVDGSFRDAVKILEQVSLQEGNITRETVERVFSLSSVSSVSDFLTVVQAKDTAGALTFVADFETKGGDCKMLITQCLQILNQELILRATGKPSSTAWDPQDLHAIIRKLTQAYIEMKGAPIAQLPLELAIVEYCTALDNNHQAFDTKKREQETQTPKVRPATPEVHNSDTVIPTNTKTVVTQESHPDTPVYNGSLTTEKLTEHWMDVIAELKPLNHSIAGIMRSTRPKSVIGDIVTVEAFYTFHRDKLSETKTRETIASVLKKLFGEKVKVEMVLGKK